MHIKRDCSEVMVQCQVCSKDFNRGQFARHECLKDLFIKKMKLHQFDVMDYIAEHLMRLRRSKEGLGLCLNRNCVERFRASTQYKAGQGMITPNKSNQSCKCLRCKTVVAAHEDSFLCMYCDEIYCPSCLGYTKYFDLQELEDMIMEQQQPMMVGMQKQQMMQ